MHIRKFVVLGFVLSLVPGLAWTCSKSPTASPSDLEKHGIFSLKFDGEPFTSNGGCDGGDAPDLQIELSSVGTEEGGIEEVVMRFVNLLPIVEVQMNEDTKFKMGIFARGANGNPYHSRCDGGDGGNLRFDVVEDDPLLDWQTVLEDHWAISNPLEETVAHTANDGTWNIYGITPCGLGAPERTSDGDVIQYRGRHGYRGDLFVHGQWMEPEYNWWRCRKHIQTDLIFTGERSGSAENDDRQHLEIETFWNQFPSRTFTLVDTGETIELKTGERVPQYRVQSEVFDPGLL